MTREREREGDGGTIIEFTTIDHGAQRTISVAEEGFSGWEKYRRLRSTLSVSTRRNFEPKKKIVILNSYKNTGRTVWTLNHSLNCH